MREYVRPEIELIDRRKIDDIALIAVLAVAVVVWAYAWVY